MTYLTTLKISRVSGVGVEVFDEKLGVGNGSEDTYDLSQDNVIAGSYVLNYAAQGSNDFTALVETTDYSLDKDSGRVLLTASGVSAISGNVLYASYTHSPKMSDTVMSSFIAAAEEEVETKTGRRWDTPIETTQIFDGELFYPYPRTDNPFASDYDPPNYVVVTRKPVTSVREVALLQTGAIFDAVLSDDGGSFTNNTEDANVYQGTSFFVFASTPAVNDAIYFGSQYKFFSIDLNHDVLGTGSPTIVWEYYDGSTWTSFTPSEDVSGASSFQANGNVSWDGLSNWSQVSVDASTIYYYVRARVDSGAYTTSPKLFNANMGRDSVVSTFVNSQDYQWTKEGRVILTGNTIPNGSQNVKVTFNYGSSDTPQLAVDLAALYAGLRVYANITGGSYDDETGYTMGRKSVSIGEVYVNVAEVVRQFNTRIDQILESFGRRNLFAA